MSGRIPADMARAVRARAANACEYCKLPQDSQEAQFHLDHIVPRSQGGPTTRENLALACVTCSLRKAARVRVRDPQTGERVRLFNPRCDVWEKHFTFTRGWRVQGTTPIGRATAAALGMNRATIISIRKGLATLRRFPT